MSAQSLVQYLLMMGPQDGSTRFEAQAHGDGGWGLILRARIIPRTSVGEAGKNESRMQKLETLVNNSAPARIDDSLADQIKGEYSRNSPLSLCL